MGTRNRWWRAIIISMALNIFLLCSLSILSAGIFQTEPVEQLLELDLVSDDSPQQVVTSGSSGSEKANVSEERATSFPTTTSSTSSFAAVQKVTSLSVDEVSTAHLATDDDVEEAQGPSSSISGSGSNTASGGQSSNGESKGRQDSGSGNPGGGIIGPKILSQVDPTYPESPRQAGITGIVFLKIQILENGRAGDVSIKQSSGNDLLDHSAVTAVYKWRFTPAQERNTGRAVACYTTLPVVFRLN